MKENTKKKTSIGEILGKGGPLIAVIILSVVLAVASPTFLTTDNWMNLFRQTALNSMIAVGMLVILLTGGIDLSVGSICAFASCLMGVAMKAGIDNSFSKWVGYIDADLQTTPQDFNKLLEFVDQYEMVMGIRTGRKDSFVKNMSSRIANGFRRMMTHDGVEDTGCPLKVLRTDYAKRIPFFTGMHRFLPALIQLQEGQVKQVPVRHFPRIAGKSKYNLANRLIGPFKDCFAYRWMRKRYINYQVAENNLNS